MSASVMLLADGAASGAAASSDRPKAGVVKASARQTTAKAAFIVDPSVPKGAESCKKCCGLLQQRQIHSGLLQYVDIFANSQFAGGDAGSCSLLWATATKDQRVTGIHGKDQVGTQRARPQTPTLNGLEKAGGKMNVC